MTYPRRRTKKRKRIGRTHLTVSHRAKEVHLHLRPHLICGFVRRTLLPIASHTHVGHAARTRRRRNLVELLFNAIDVISMYSRERDCMRTALLRVVIVYNSHLPSSIGAREKGREEGMELSSNELRLTSPRTIRSEFSLRAHRNEGR